MAHRWQAHPMRPSRRRVRRRVVAAPALVVLAGLIAAAGAPWSNAFATFAAPGSAPTAPLHAVAVHDTVADSIVEAAVAANSAGSGRIAHRRSAPTKAVVNPPARPATAVPRLGRGSTAVFLGDSYTSGWQGAGIGGRGWPRLVAADRGWRVINLAVPGTGFLNPGWTGQPLGSLVGRAIDKRPDVVVVAAGHNDSRWAATATEAAADLAIDRLHRSLPHAIIVVVGPIWQDGSPPQRCLALRDHLRRTAARVGAVFVDPIAGRWFAGRRHAMIRADGIHPDDAGHRWMAARVLDALERSRL